MSSAAFPHTTLGDEGAGVELGEPVPAGGKVEVVVDVDVVVLVDVVVAGGKVVVEVADAAGTRATTPLTAVVVFGFSPQLPVEAPMAPAAMVAMAA